MVAAVMFCSKSIGSYECSCNSGYQLLSLGDARGCGGIATEVIELCKRLPNADIDVGVCDRSTQLQWFSSVCK